ncbi:MAG: PilZ domain-containing protein, partial [Rhodopila sp.]
QLANQTAQSTQAIARHIAQIRSATGASVAAVARIEETITAITEIAGSIAEAVQQQGAATVEITRNVIETARAATEMTTRNQEVSAEASDTGRRAADVRDNATSLNEEMQEMRHFMIRVVRTSTSEVDRRAHQRFEADLPCRLTVAGRVYEARVRDLSDGGASLLGVPPHPLDTPGKLDIEGVGMAMPIVVRRSEDDSLQVTFVSDAATAARIEGALARLKPRQAA